MAINVHICAAECYDRICGSRNGITRARQNETIHAHL